MKLASEEIEVLFFKENGGICRRRHMESPSSICHNVNCSKVKVDRIIQQIDAAKYSIDMAIYTFTYKNMFDAFTNALQRGVILRIICDKEMLLTTGSLVCKLAESGCEYRAPKSNTAMMHHKFMVIDGKNRLAEIKRTKDKKNKRVEPYKSVVLNGSANWTQQGFCGNWENCVITNLQEDIEAFETEFDRLWKALENPTV